MHFLPRTQRRASVLTACLLGLALGGAMTAAPLSVLAQVAEPDGVAPTEASGSPLASEAAPTSSEDTAPPTVADGAAVASEGEPDDVPPAEDDGIRFDLAAGTALPVHVGVQGLLELPYRIQLAGEVGWMPQGYVDLVNAVCTGFGWYDEATAGLIGAALENALVLRAAAGWRPLPEEGFEVRVGYTAALLGGGLSAAESIEAVTGRDVRSAGQEIPLQAVLHGFQVALSWAFVIERAVLVRLELSYFQVFWSDTWIAASAGRGDAAVQAASAALDTYLNDVLTTYVKTPTLSVFVGYRFE